MHTNGISGIDDLPRTKEHITKIWEDQGYCTLNDWRESLHIAKEEGMEEVVRLAFIYPNDQELGNIIRRMSWKLKP